MYALISLVFGPASAYVIRLKEMIKQGYLKVTSELVPPRIIDLSNI
jgi:hypothetical protein